jgi:hypothetical protein
MNFPPLSQATFPLSMISKLLLQNLFKRQHFPCHLNPVLQYERFFYREKRIEEHFRKASGKDKSIPYILILLNSQQKGR